MDSVKCVPGRTDDKIRRPQPALPAHDPVASADPRTV